jgi:hypothetical protein
LESNLKALRLENGGSQNAFLTRFPDISVPKQPPAGPNGPNVEQFTERWGQVRSEVATTQDQLLRRAVNAYTVENINRVGSREQANHFLSLNRWYQSAIKRLYGTLDNCRAAILSYSNLTASPAAVTSPADTAVTVAPGGSASSPPNPILNSWALAEIESRQCSLDSADLGDPPDRSDFGLTLGFVGSLSGWLLRTESMPLALIVGLIGFGLLGALVSQFIRAAEPTAGALDLFGIVWRGVSAAIVVFLAAYGGIAIVTQSAGSSDPNPFVIFVTCLVGAVFADDVWNWARKKLKLS